MLDIKLIREEPKVVEKNLEKRGDEEKLALLKELIKKDEEWRAVLADMERLKFQRNKISQEIGELKKRGKDVSSKMKEAGALPDRIAKNEEKAAELKKRIDWILMRLPNLLHDSVPFGKDDSENVELRKIGKAPKFKFVPKNHLEILEGLGLIDSERAAKVSGRGFFYNLKELAVLDWSIQRLALDFLVKKGFSIVNPPYMLRRKPYEGVTDVGDFEDVMYKIEGEDLYLIATSEHAIAAMFKDEVLNSSDLPLKFAGISPCFRKEVGAHGKYTKGLFRMHQFHKVEQFVFSNPSNSWSIHEELQKNSEELYKLLEIPIRVVNVCTGDIGSIAAKKYDIEGLMADGAYRELGSNSNCTDYQARRLGIRFREKEGQKPVGFVHTLNNTALATSRTMVCLIENQQQSDGSVKMPKALWKYTGFKEIGK